jgi:hypothetical protein
MKPTCSVFLGLEKEWGVAIRDNSHALNPGVTLARGMSSAKLNQWREDSYHEVQRIESKMNAHVEKCEICQRDGIPKFDISEIKN